MAQEIPTPLGFGKDLPSGHTHTDACFTVHLLESEEGKQAIAEYRRWVEDGRPDVRRKGNTEDMQTLSVGTTRSFKVINFSATGNQQNVTYDFVLRHMGSKVNIWVQTSEFDPNKVSQQKVDDMAAALEVSTPALSFDPTKGIIENNESVFGPRPNVDDTGVVHLLAYRFYSGEIPTGSYVAGYFAPVNLSSTNANSNFADIIHINSNPAVYRDNGTVNLGGILNTVAHEDQHLVHANAGNLNTYQNEGQSEWASVLNGYPTRSTAYLNTPTNVNIDLFTWRGGSDVLYDYARAGLFHNYLGDRFGRTRIGALSGNGSNGVQAYSTVLSGTGVTFADAITDYHVANWVNDTALDGGKYGYTSTQRRNVSVVNPAENYSSVLLDIQTDRTIQFGGAEYLKMTGVRNPQLTLSGSANIRYKLILQPVTGPMQLQDVTGSQTLNGDFEYVTLVAVNPSSGPAGFSLTANWDPLPFVTEELSYSGNSQFFAELPGDANIPEQPTRRFFKGYALRIDPTYSGQLQQLSFLINGGDESIVGSGTLRLSLMSAVLGTPEADNTPRYLPDAVLFSTDVDFADIGSGYNTVDVREDNWLVTGNTNYFVLLEVVDHSVDARLEFLLDNGSTDPNDSNYYPIRTLIKRVDDSNVTTWGAWSGRNNQLVSATIFSEYTGPLVTPILTNLPTEPIRILTGQELVVSVSATGTPDPIFQWRRNGTMIAGQNTNTLRLPGIQRSDAGTYEVRATNFAGFTTYETFEVDVVSNQYALTQNVPNPFNPATRIEYTLVAGSDVSLKVYDMTGRLVKTLVNDRQTRGVYTIDFDATGLASGVYVYEIITKPTASGASYRNAKMMTIIR
jgi:hypothetical protein